MVYFRFPFRKTAFWIIFITLMLPVEVRIYPTYKVVADLKLLDTYAGLILPLIASATGTLLFRQFFMTVPDELLEASRIDGAGPFRFFRDTLLPLSVTTMAALFVIQFIYGWNQYLWPLLITTQRFDADHRDRHQEDAGDAGRARPNGSSRWRPRCSRCCRRSRWSSSCSGCSCAAWSRRRSERWPT